MSFFNWQIGDKLLASRLNQVNRDTDSRLTPVEHNVFELFLQNYFDGKTDIPFQAMFFDGFSDELKTGSVSGGVAVDTPNKKLDFVAGATNTKAADFERDDAEVLQISNAAQTGLDPSGSDFTIEMWLKVESDIPTSSQYTLFQKNIGVPQGSYDYAYTRSPGGLREITLAIFNGASSTPHTFPVDLGVGTYVHVAVTWTDSTRTCVLYIDGVSQGNSPNSGGGQFILNGTAPISIGANNGTTNTFDGLFDELRFWSSARTGTEINDNKDVVLAGSETDLEGYWKFEDDFLDATANNNDLTESGGTIDFVADVPFGSAEALGNYISIVSTFQQAKKSVKLWVTRTFNVQFNLDSAIAVTDTTLTILGDQTSKFANGNTIDISDENNFVRERKTLNAVPSFGGGVTTLTFTPAIDNASGFGTTAFVERVDLLPQVSLVDFEAADSFEDMTFVQSIVDFANNEVEDEYDFVASQAEEDFKVKLNFTREDLDVGVEAKRLGTVLSES